MWGQTMGNKEKTTWIGLRLMQLFDLFKLDLGRVDCIIKLIFYDFYMYIYVSNWLLNKDFYNKR